MLEQNGDMFQAPPRRDYVSPFEPEDGGEESGPGLGAGVSLPVGGGFVSQ